MHVPWDASLAARFRCASGRAELRNVLRAFARRVPAVRYCQGLNFIAALLLVVFQNEARSKRGQVLKQGGGKSGRKIETVCISHSRTALNHALPNLLPNQNPSRQRKEQAFWTLVCAFDALGCEGYYTDRMLLLRTDMQVLGTFMKVKCPKVAKAKHGRDGTPIRGWALVEGLPFFWVTSSLI